MSTTMISPSADTVHGCWAGKIKEHKSQNTVAGIIHCWIWFPSWALTLLKFESSTVSQTRPKRTWGSPSSWPMWYDFSRSEVRIRLRKTFSGWWIRQASLTTPPVSWPNKNKRLNANFFSDQSIYAQSKLYLITWVLNARILDLSWGMMAL